MWSLDVNYTMRGAIYGYQAHWVDSIEQILMADLLWVSTRCVNRRGVMDVD